MTLSDRYNMAFAMASVGHDNRSLPDSTFIMGGRTYHRIGAMEPQPLQPASFAQIYLLDPDESAARRLEVIGHDDGVLRAAVLAMLHQPLPPIVAVYLRLFLQLLAWRRTTHAQHVAPVPATQEPELPGRAELEPEVLLQVPSHRCDAACASLRTHMSLQCPCQC